MASKTETAKGPATYTHWKRPHTRMYDYNYQVAESYYKPQVQYSGYLGGRDLSRKSRRRSVEPPPPQSFQERWAANPFYGKELDPYEVERQQLMRQRNHEYMTRARSLSNPDLRNDAFEEEIQRQRNIRSSVSRARSVLSCDRDYIGDYGDYVTFRGTRARSVSTQRPMDDMDVEWEWKRDGDFEELCRRASRDDRERSVYEYRMSLDPDPRKIPMTTTLSHGLYKNSLYGTFSWDPKSYLPGRP